MQQSTTEHPEAIAWAMQAWDWIGGEIVNFGIRWVAIVAIGIAVSLFVRRSIRKDTDMILDYLGIDRSMRHGIKPRKVLSWLKPSAKPPATRTWIDRKEALALIRESSVVMRKSPRRKQRAKTVLDQLTVNLTPLTQVTKPSGEFTYQNKYEHEVSTGLLDTIISSHPDAEQNGKYSREIIVFELCQMALQAALVAND